MAHSVGSNGSARWGASRTWNRSSESAVIAIPFRNPPAKRQTGCLADVGTAGLLSKVE
jgi:hypothetical protein